MARIPGTSRVIDRLFIGSAHIITWTPYLRQAGLIHILQLQPIAGQGPVLSVPLPPDGIAHPTTRPSMLAWPDDFDVCYNPVADHEFLPFGVLRRGVDFICRHMSGGRRVMVICKDGMSRSPAFVLAYLLENGYNLPGAWQQVKTQHRIANLTESLWYSLIVHYELPYTIDEVASWATGE